MDALTQYLVAVLPSSIASILSILAIAFVRAYANKLYNKVGKGLEVQKQDVDQILKDNAELKRENAELKREMVRFMRYQRGIGEVEEDEKQK